MAFKHVRTSNPRSTITNTRTRLRHKAVSPDAAESSRPSAADLAVGIVEMARRHVEEPKERKRSTPDARSRGRSCVTGVRPDLDRLDFMTGRAASAPGRAPTFVPRPWMGRDPAALLDPSLVAQIELLEAVGRELTRRGPLDVLRRVRARSNERLAKVFRRGGGNGRT